MSRFNRIVLPAILALGLAIAVLSIASARFGPTVDALFLARTLDGVSVSTQIGVTFTEPMNRRSVERAFRITPSVAGTIAWSGHELLFTPKVPLAYQRSYVLTISTSAQSTTAKSLFRPYQVSFTTQSRHLVYVGTEGNERNQLVLASMGGQREVVSSGGNAVMSYALSFDHSLAVYVARGSSSERPDELWLLSLTDNSTQMIYRRPEWNMSQPHFSPDGHFIVFLATNVRICQRYYGCYIDRSGPVIYLLDLRTHKVAPFRSRSAVPITSFIDFSPANQLAFTDLGSALTLADPNGSHVVHIPNRGNSLEYQGFSPQGDQAVFVGQTPDSTGGDILIYKGGKYHDISRHVYDSSVPSISPSDHGVAYSAYRTEWHIEPVYGINVFNEITGKTTRVTALSTWSDWAPQWSPDGRYLAFIRSLPQEAMYMGSGAIWTVRPDGSDAQPLAAHGRDVRWL